MNEIKKLEKRDRQIANDGREPIPIKAFILYSGCSLIASGVFCILAYAFVSMFLQIIQK